MTFSHKFSKRDANHTPLVKMARGLGFSVLEVHMVGGALDLVLGYYGIDQRVEVKDPKKPPSARKLTKAEKETFESWKGRPPVVIETVAQLHELQAAMLKEAQS